MYKVIILPLARKDIEEAANWYNQKHPGLGKRFIAHVREKTRFIRQNPKAVAVRYDDVRTAVLDTFPYMIHYSIDEDNKSIIISAVLSSRRDPNVWKGRK